MSRTVQHIIGAILLVFLTGLPVLALLCAPMCDSTPVSAASNTSAATPAHAGCHDAAPETDRHRASLDALRATIQRQLLDAARNPTTAQDPGTTPR